MTMTMGEIRADVVRVARICGKPDGVAPAIGQYRLIGSLSPSTLRGLVGTYKARGKPELTWEAAMEALGFTTARKWRGERQRVKYVPCETCQNPRPVLRDYELEIEHGQGVAEGVLS